ncbi:MAG: MFS transporter [Alphaproteobacteria bacterium]|nr:MFS transporter [Alphaproteobacteria bacterium]
MFQSVRSASQRSFARLAWSNLFAQFSEQVALAAAPLVAVLLLAASATDTGLLQTAQTLPFLLLSIPAGILTDRRSRRGLMTGAEILRAASLLATLFCIGTHFLSLEVLAALGFLGAAGTVCYSVAAPALVPGIVRRDELAGANRWLELARSTAFAAGPAIGGAVVGFLGGSAAYALATALSVFAALLLAGINEGARPSQARRHLLHELREGAGFIFGNLYLRPILFTAVVFNTSWFVLQSVYVAYAVHGLDLTAAEVGITLGAYGFGMVTGALLAPRLALHLSTGAMIGAGPLSALIAAVLMLTTIRWPSGVLAGASFFLFGAGPILWTITTTTLRQSVTPNAMLGRVSALIVTATFGARPIGAGLGALVAARFGTEACLAAAAAGFVLQFLILFASPVLRLGHLPEEKTA